MLAAKALLTLLAGLAAAAPHSYYDDDCDDFSIPTGCAEVDVLFIGLPPNHPLVVAQGYNTTQVAQALNRDRANILAAGYNVQTLFFGPEVPISFLSDATQSREWHGAGVGFGVRGAPRADLTVHFEEILRVYRDELNPQAKIFFNYNPMTTLWALQRNFPLSSNCTNQPGKDLGYTIKCDIC